LIQISAGDGKRSHINRYFVSQWPILNPYQLFQTTQNAGCGEEMNLLHISDIHFGPRHWEGNDERLLEKLNSYAADIVINTGDNTTDGLESEYDQAGRFLKKIKCEHVISLIGNHDKRNMRSQELFKQHISDIDSIYPLMPDKCVKKNLFLDRDITKIGENFTDNNFIKTLEVNGDSVLIVSIDTSQLYSDYGYVDEELLRTVSEHMDLFDRTAYEKALLLVHYSILGTDEHPLSNPLRLIDFVRRHNIEHVFCGHTHELELRQTIDLYHGHTFTQYMCGSLSSCNNVNDSNMFLYYENLADEDMQIHVVRIYPKGDQLIFNEEIVAAVPKQGDSYMKLA
jgi:3',5'-cyclic AMP phosphodiesterase CpdA